MKKNLLFSGFILLTALISLSSCMRNSYPQFTGRYHHKIQDNKKAVVSTKQDTRNNEEASKLSKIQEQEPVLASVDLQPQDIIPQNFPSQPSAFYSKPKIEKQPTYHSDMSKSEERTDNTTVAESSAVKEQKSGHSGFGSFFSHGDRVLSIIVAIFFPFLGVLIYDEALTIHFWIALILTLLFWLPGFIYALLVILED